MINMFSSWGGSQGNALFFWVIFLFRIVDFGFPDPELWLFWSYKWTGDEQEGPAESCLKLVVDLFKLVISGQKKSHGLQVVRNLLRYLILFHANSRMYFIA